MDVIQERGRSRGGADQRAGDSRYAGLAHGANMLLPRRVGGHLAHRRSVAL